jgi:sarcosine oxidase, subunit beta
MPTAEVVIAGAGIAGIAAAYELAVVRGAGPIVIADDQPPMTVTSDKSTECYRNFWPGPDRAMVAFMNRSIDRLEALAHTTGNAFRMNRRGYLYVTRDPAQIWDFRATAAAAAVQGAGALRESAYVPNAECAGDLDDLARIDFDRFPSGADLVTDSALIRRHFPALAPDTAAVLHVRRAGWFSGQELGMRLLEAALGRGVGIAHARVTGVERDPAGIAAVKLADGTRIASRNLVLATGPWLRESARIAGEDLPVFSELHTKVAFHDHRRAIPRDSPLLIWADAQALAWSAEERAMLAEESGTRALLGELPPGAHTRPEGEGGSDVALMLWAYDARPVPERWPPVFDPIFPDVVLRGLVPMLPGLAAYVGHAPQPIVDGGYYTKTRENRPLVGPLAMPGVFVSGAYSGYGLMAAAAGAELLAAHVTRSPLPDYAAAIAPNRYADPSYAARFAEVGDAGQL